jgi:hypothetical protein
MGPATDAPKSVDSAARRRILFIEDDLANWQTYTAPEALPSLEQLCTRLARVDAGELPRNDKSGMRSRR